MGGPGPATSDITAQIRSFPSGRRGGSEPRPPPAPARQPAPRPPRAAWAASESPGHRRAEPSRAEPSERRRRAARRPGAQPSAAQTSPAQRQPGAAESRPPFAGKQRAPAPPSRRGLAAGSRAPPSASAARPARSGATSSGGVRGLGAGACRSASGQLPDLRDLLRSLGLPGARALRLRFPDATSSSTRGDTSVPAFTLLAHTSAWHSLGPCAQSSPAACPASWSSHCRTSGTRHPGVNC